jgi:hypothetical protein
MALTFPLSVADFFGGLKVSSCSFDIGESVEVSRNGGGELLTADMGARLMAGQVTLSTQLHREAEAVKARLSALRQAGRSLFVHPRPTFTPSFDPTGSILGATIPTIHTINANRRELRLQNLPVGYILSQGDWLSFSYGTSPVRYAIHQIVETVTVPAGGISPSFEVSTFIRPGAAVSAPVQLVRPFFKAIIVPGSVNVGGSIPIFTSGIQFSILQTLR